MSLAALEFRDRSIVVTGRTQGTARAVIPRFADAGGVVVTAARSSTPAGLPVHTYVQADLTRTAGIEALVNAIRDGIGGVDVIIQTLGGSSAPGGGVCGAQRRPLVRGAESQPARGRPSRPSVGAGYGETWPRCGRARLADPTVGGTDEEQARSGHQAISAGFRSDGRRGLRRSRSHRLPRVG